SGPARLILSIAVADGHDTHETLTVVQDGLEVEVTELRDDFGTRLHSCHVDQGTVEVNYQARIDGRSEPVAVGKLDPIRYLRPSRYCESDTLTPTAVAEAGGRSGHELVEFVGSWVGTQLAYI